MAEENDDKQFAHFTLADIDEGKLAFEINEGLKTLTRDLADINKDPTKARSLSVKIAIAGAKNRRIGVMKWSVSPTLAPREAEEPATIFIGKDPVTGEAFAQLDRIDQPVLPGTEKAFNARLGDDDADDESEVVSH